MSAEDHPDVRASDGERERTIDALRTAGGEGRLTFEELADRVEVAAAATTRDELQRLTNDLPADGRVADVVAPGGGPAPGGEIVAPAQHSSLFGDVRRSGPWLVPQHSSWKSCFGDIVLDLREGRVGAAEVTIEANTVFGTIDVLVPEGIVVDLRCRTVLGDVKQEAGDLAPLGAPRVIVTGRTIFGNVRVRAQRLRERIADRILGASDRG